MPYASKAQQRWAHANEGKPGGTTHAQVKEFDSKTNFANLPERAKKKKKKHRTFHDRAAAYAETH